MSFLTLFLGNESDIRIRRIPEQHFFQVPLAKFV